MKNEEKQEQTIDPAQNNEEEMKEGEKKETIKRVGQIMNEDGEWEEYIEEEEADKPPIAYTYMGGE